jgi:DNA (cytosine-5)-methyltransferase 1
MKRVQPTLFEPELPESDANPWTRGSPVEESGYVWKGEPVVFDRAKALPKSGLVAVELFCGCGGTSVGLEMAGMVCAVGCDLLEPAIQTYRSAHPRAAAILGDVRAVDPETIVELLEGRTVDVLVGGFPCQGFSLNNRKRHDEDPRNRLFEQFVRFAKALKPRAVLAENVSSIRSAEAGAVVENILTGLSDAIEADVQAEVFNAADFGVPQTRRRMIFMGVRGQSSPITTVERTHGEGRIPWVSVGEAISDLPRLSSGQSSSEYASAPKNDFQRLMRSESNGILVNHEAPDHPQETIDRIGNTKPGQPMYPAFKQRIRLHPQRPSPTQVSGGIRPQFQFGHPTDARGLTIRERARMQSIPDHVNFAGGLVQGRVQTGNAVPPLMARALGKALARALRSTKK